MFLEIINKTKLTKTKITSIQITQKSLFIEELVKTNINKLIPEIKPTLFCSIFNIKSSPSNYITLFLIQIIYILNN